MMTSPPSVAFAAGGELESGCQADYGIQALGKRHTTILCATHALKRRVSCARWIGGWIDTIVGEKLLRSTGTARKRPSGQRIKTDSTRVFKRALWQRLADTVCFERTPHAVLRAVFFAWWDVEVCFSLRA
jgi:hypothetical protein